MQAALHQTTTTLSHLSHLLDRMDEHCRPATFYHLIRPFLAGSKNMAAAGLPRGVFYDEGHGEGTWRCLRGGSNGQSSLVQFLDLALGVEHRSAGGGGEKGFHEEVRGYMPEGHRRFLEEVKGRYPGGVRKVVEGLEGEEEGVREAFGMATRALAEFRGRHLQMVTRYIVIPSRQPCVSKGMNLATASSGLRATDTERDGVHVANKELTGTGGTALLPFLKQSRDETLQAGLLRAE